MRKLENPVLNEQKIKENNHKTQQMEKNGDRQIKGKTSGLKNAKIMVQTICWRGDYGVELFFRGWAWPLTSSGGNS